MKAAASALVGALALSALPVLALGASAGQTDPLEGMRQQGRHVTWGAPIFGQVLVTPFPENFTPVYENTRGTHYMREAVLVGESAQQWTQMLTVTGDKGLASDAEMTLRRFAEVKADQWKYACPGSFSAQAIGTRKVGTDDGYIFLLSCGTSPASGGRTSETALIIALRGGTNFYTVQWAERGDKSDVPLPINASTWRSRLTQLLPIKMCPLNPGDASPVTACISAH